MKIIADIVEPVKPEDDFVVVQFQKDPLKQKFEVYCKFDAFAQKMRKYDVWQLWIKFESVEYIEKKSGKTRYATKLTCHLASFVSGISNK